MNLESKILNNDVEKPKNYFLSNPKRFFPTLFSLLSQLFVIISCCQCVKEQLVMKGVLKIKKE
jgi:hypothetical protein